MRKHIYITTSWDDGHPLDMRLAALLTKYQIKGTFYIPCRNSENPVMNDNELQYISNQFEIGGHTLNHVYLNSICDKQAEKEIFECRKILKDKTGQNVTSFCFPGGKFTARDVKIVENAGFLFGRTVDLFHIGKSMNKSLLYTTLQAYNHKRNVLIKHCVKRIFFTPFLKYFLNPGIECDFKNLANLFFNSIEKKGGAFHLWGHSWEIEKFQLWDELESVLKLISFKKNAHYLTNTEYWKLLS